MNEFRFAAALGAEADVGAAGLEVGAVGTGGNFPVGILTGQPHFEVIGFCGAEAHVAGTQGNGTIRQF